MARVPKHLQGIFDDDAEAKCPPLRQAMVRAAEAKLGYSLPESYIQLLKIKNGAYLKRKFCPTEHRKGRPIAYAWIHSPIRGIGGEAGIDAKLGSQYLIAEWGYPDVGVVISSDGHTALMLDYSKCGPEGEPHVIYVDVETGTGKPAVDVLAPDFETFLSRLVEKSPTEEIEPKPKPQRKGKK